MIISNRFVILAKLTFRQKRKYVFFSCFCWLMATFIRYLPIVVNVAVTVIFWSFRKLIVSILSVILPLGISNISDRC